MTFQAVIRDPQERLLSVASTTINVKILSPNGCILREEEFPQTSINQGYLSLSVTAGLRAGADPHIPVTKVFDNSAPISGLVCINEDGSKKTNVTSYTPTANDARFLRLSLQNNADLIVADFNMRTVPFAVNSETLNGKTALDFIAVNDSANVNQTSLENLFSQITKLDQMISNYNASTGTLTTNISGNATSADGLTGVLAISSGGTGGSTAANARVNLGAAGSGSNSDITSLQGVTSISSPAALNISSGGVNQNITLTPSGTGVTTVTGNLGVGVASPNVPLEVNGIGKVEQLQLGDSTAIEGGACVDGTLGRDGSGNFYICN